MLNIHFCDDENHYLEKVQTILNNYAHDHQIEVETSASGSLNALEQYIFTEGGRPDILFLDIAFDKEQDTSICVAEKISRQLPACSIVFLTNYLSYATDVYGANHFYYVLKDELESRLDAILKRYYERNQKIVLHTKKMDWSFDANDIMYVERDRRCCYIFLSNGENKKVALGFEHAAEKFHHPMFVRCHNSFIINLNYLQQYASDTFVLKNGKEIPISRSYQKDCRQKFLSWQEVWV